MNMKMITTITRALQLKSLMVWRSTGEPDEDTSEDDDLMRQLVFPYSDQEPCLTPDEMAPLDAIAQLVETTRLKKMGVVLPVQLRQFKVRNQSTCPHVL